MTVKSESPIQQLQDAFMTAVELLEKHHEKLADIEKRLAALEEYQRPEKYNSNDSFDNDDGRTSYYDTFGNPVREG